MGNSNIKGIEITIKGNTQPLQDALKEVNKKSERLQSELKQVEKLLKFDPSNVEILAQKQKLLADAIENGKSKLETLKIAQQQAQQQFEKGKMGEEQYRALQREVAYAEQSLNRLQARQSASTRSTTENSQAVEENTSKTEELSKSIETTDKKLELEKAELEKNTAGLKENKDKQEILKQTRQSLISQMDLQKGKIEALNQQIEELTKAEGDNEDAIIERRTELARAETAMEQYRQQLSRTEEQMSSLSRASQGLANFGNGMTNAGKKLMPVTAAIAGIGAAAVSSFNTVVEGLDAVMLATGATGDKAKQLEDVYENVAAKIPADFASIGGAIGEINTRFGYMGDELESTAMDFMKFSKITGVDATASVRLVSRAMGDAGIEAGEYKELLNLLAKASQDSGVQVDSLTESIAKYGAPMRALGFDTKSSIALFAQWELAGVTTEIAFSGMKKAISNWSSAGKDARVEFQKTLDEISKCPDIATATTKAIEVFGQKAGPDLADAIQGGKFAYEDFLKTLESSQNVVEDTYGMVVYEINDSQLAMQNMQIAMKDIGQTILTTMGPVLLELAEKLKSVIDKFGDLDEDTKKTIIVIMGLVAGLAPLLIIIGQTSIGISAVVGALGKMKIAVAATGGEVGIFSKSLAFLIANPVVAAVVAIGAALGYVALAANEAKKAQEQLNEKMIETVQIKNDMNAMTATEIEAMEQEKTALMGQISTYEALNAAMVETNARRAELEMRQATGKLLTEAERKELQELNSKMRNLAESTRVCNSELTEQYGSLENGRATLEAYKVRVSNAEKANKLLAATTNETAQAMVKEGLSLQTASAQAKDLYSQYEILINKEKRTGEETTKLNQLKSALIGTMGDSVVAINKETGEVEINKQALLSELVVTDTLSNAKIDCVKAFNEGGILRVQKQKEETKAVIESLQIQLRAMAAASAAFGIQMAASGKGGNILAPVQLANQAVQSSITATMSAKNTALKEMESFSAQVKKISEGTSNSVGSYANNAGDAIKKAAGGGGSAAQKAKEDILDAAITTYEENKSLGKMTLKEEISKLDAIKKGNSDTSAHIIKVNSFAQEQLIDNVNRRKEIESITIDEEIKLYEHAKEIYCINATDRAKFDKLINEAVLTDVANMTAKKDDYSKKELENLETKLLEKKELYKQSETACKEIDKQILENKKAMNEKELEETGKHWEKVLDVGEKISNNLKDISKETGEKIIEQTYETAIKNIDEYYTERDKRVSLMTDGTDKNIVQLQKEVSATQKATDTKIKLYEQEYKAKCSLIDNETNAATKAIQDQIDAMDKAKEEESRQQDSKDYDEKMAGLYEKLGNADGKESENVLAEIQKAEADRQKQLLEQQRSDKKESLREEIESIRETANQKKQTLESELEEKQYNLEQQREKEIEHMNTVIELMQQQVNKKMELEQIQTEIKGKELELQSENVDEETKNQTRIDLEQLKKQESNLVKSLNTDRINLQNFTPILQTISNQYGQTFLDGFTSTEYDIRDYVDRMVEYMRDRLESAANSSRGSDGRHLNGLDNVPFDGYRAILDKGERVLTAAENREYNRGKSGSGGSTIVQVTQQFYSPVPNPRAEQKQAVRGLRKLGLMV